MPLLKQNTEYPKMSLANIANDLSGVMVWKCLQRHTGWRPGFPIWWCYWEVKKCMWGALLTRLVGGKAWREVVGHWGILWRGSAHFLLSLHSGYPRWAALLLYGISVLQETWEQLTWLTRDWRLWNSQHKWAFSPLRVISLCISVTVIKSWLMHWLGSLLYLGDQSPFNLYQAITM